MDKIKSVAGHVASAIRKEGEFLAGNPHQVVNSSGGAVWVWSQVFEQIQDATLGAALIVVDPSALSLPQFSDSSELSYVESGSAYVGLISPFGIPTKVKKITKGDFWAIPRGWTQYVWNDSSHEPIKFFSVAETSGGAKKDRYTASYLLGASKGHMAPVLHGFSKELLAHAWQVDEAHVDKLLTSQRDLGFVKVTEEQTKSFLSEVEGGSFGEFPEFIYNIHQHSPEVQTEAGGFLTFLNGFKLPVLKSLGLGATLVHLKPGAMEAPHFTNAPRIIYVTAGKGHVELANSAGQPALRTEVNKGQVFVVPSFYVVSLWANSVEPFEWVGFSHTAKSSHPTPTYLAGANSIYKKLPLEVVAAGFGIKAEEEEKIREKRSSPEEVGLLPPPDGVKGGSASGLEQYMRKLQLDMAEGKDL